MLEMLSLLFVTFPALTLVGTGKMMMAPVEEQLMYMTRYSTRIRHLGWLLTAILPTNSQAAASIAFRGWKGLGDC